MSTAKPLLSCHRNKGSDPTELGKVRRGCPAAMSSGCNLWMWGALTQWYCSGGQWLSAVAEGCSRVLQEGQECSSPHPPPASSHDRWTIIKMTVLWHWKKANAQCKNIYWWKGIQDYITELERCAVKRNRESDTSSINATESHCDS